MQRTFLIVALAVATSTSTTAHAGSVGDMGLSADQIRSLNAQLTAPVVAPGIAFGSPVAYGADWGQLFAGVGGQTLPAGSGDSVDGSMLVGMGFGDSQVTAGLELSATVISITDDFGADGSFNAKMHRALPGRASVALGVEETQGWGLAETTQPSIYAVYTQTIDLVPQSPRRPVPLVFNVGAGDERFVDPGEGGVGLFASVSVHPHRQLALIADYTGRGLNAAVSIVPLRRTPLVVTLGAVNLTGRLGGDVEFAGGIGLLHQF